MTLIIPNQLHLVYTLANVTKDTKSELHKIN
jgi:hypothetical protein